MSVYVGFKVGKAKERKAYVSEYYCGGCGYPVSDHDSYCPKCGGAFRKEDATERTCKAIDDFVLPGQKQTYPYKICSNCHSDFPRLACNGEFSVENYCPNCGARVVK